MIRYRYKTEIDKLDPHMPNIKIRQQSRMYHGFAGMVVLALKSEFAAQTHLKALTLGTGLHENNHHTKREEIP